MLGKPGGRPGPLQQDGLNHIMPDQLKVRLVQQVHDVVFGASEEVVHADDMHSTTQQGMQQLLLDARPGPKIVGTERSLANVEGQTLQQSIVYHPNTGRVSGHHLSICPGYPMQSSC
jgi:hypothetical protein